MKKVSLFVILFMSQISTSFAQDISIYANAITANNIAAFQHSIMTTAIDKFESGNIYNQKRPDKKNLYGKPKMYGEPPLYGEYGDDGSIITTQAQGRSAGDVINHDEKPTINNTWLNWKHFYDDVKFSGYDKINTNTDLIMLAISGDNTENSSWGLFTGYVGSEQNNDFINLYENGGYIGLYKGYGIQNLNISIGATAGTVDNHVENNYYENTDFSNFWLGGALNINYNFTIDDTMVIQPGMYIGYTWIKSANYISTLGNNIENQNFNVFEVNPEISILKYIGAGWTGSINFKYRFIMWQDGTLTVNNNIMDDLYTRDYAEYGIGIEKNIDKFYISMNINRVDGGRYGWNGGLRLKYIF